MFSKQSMPGNTQDMKLSLKGCALIAAVESGLLPEIERDGVTGYDDELFSRFWAMYNELVKKTNQRFYKKRKR